VAGKDAAPLKFIGLVIRLGMSMALPVIAGVLGGRFLDRRMGTGNVFLVVSAIAGIIISFVNLYRQASKMTDKK
jgi:ATP synthase protein I